MITTPLYFRSVIDRMTPDPILVTPLKDEQIFFPECFAALTIVSGDQIGRDNYKIIISLAGILAFILSYVGIIRGDFGLVVNLCSIILIFLEVLAVFFIIQPAHVVFASCLYAMMLPVLAALQIALLQMMLFLIGGCVTGYYLIRIFFPGSFEDWLHVLMFTTVTLLITASGAALSARLGLHIFSRLRRRS